MIIKKKKVLTGIYKNEDDRKEEREAFLSNGYIIVDEGYASFGEDSLNGIDGYKPGEIYLYTVYEKVFEILR